MGGTGSKAHQRVQPTSKSVPKAQNTPYLYRLWLFMPLLNNEFEILEYSKYTVYISPHNRIAGVSGYALPLTRYGGVRGYAT